MEVEPARTGPGLATVEPAGQTSDISEEVLPACCVFAVVAASLASLGYLQQILYFHFLSYPLF